MGPNKWPEHDRESKGKDGKHHWLTYQQDTICVNNSGKYSVMFLQNPFIGNATNIKLIEMTSK